MGQPNKKPSTETPDEILAPVQTSSSVLREIAVAIDPPPDGAVGIRELLDRLDFMAEANFFPPQPQRLTSNRYQQSPLQAGTSLTFQTLTLLRTHSILRRGVATNSS